MAKRAGAAEPAARRAEISTGRFEPPPPDDDIDDHSRMESLPDSDWYLANVVIPAGPPDEREMTPVERWQAQWTRRAGELAAANSPAHRRVAELACAQGFVLTTDQARGAGVGRPELRRLLRSGRWSFVRRSVVTPLVVHDRESRLALHVAGAALARPSTVASHESAAVVHGVPVLHRPNSPTITSSESTLSGHRALSTPGARPWPATRW